MAYLERGASRRADLSSSLPGVASVLVLGASHAHPDPGVPAGGIRVGRVARYAWSRDYHQVLAQPLASLAQLARSGGARTRAYVDHGPLLERELAGRAFLGWRGRSGMLVSQELGAYLSLAVLLTDLPWPPGQEQLHPDRCGRCQRCVSACPTGAILPDRRIDARRCVSYLTGELRGPTHPALRPAIGSWLLGCDGCLEACPWSAHAGRLSRLLTPEPELAHPDLRSFFGVSGRSFLRRYQGTAFARPGRAKMAHNACVVLGNLGEAGAPELLLQAALDPSPSVREAAAWGLSRLETRAARRALAGLTRDPNPWVASSAEEFQSRSSGGSSESTPEL